MNLNNNLYINQMELEVDVNILFLHYIIEC